MLDNSFQCDEAVRKWILADREAAMAVHEYMRLHQGSSDLICYVCGNFLKDSFRFLNSPLSILRGEGECKTCGMPYYLYHYVPVRDCYLRIDYFHNDWDRERLQNMQKIWLLSDCNRAEFWREAMLAYPPDMSGGVPCI